MSPTPASGRCGGSTLTDRVRRRSGPPTRYCNIRPTQNRVFRGRMGCRSSMTRSMSPCRPAITSWPCPSTRTARPAQAAFTSMFGADDFAFDKKGNLYATTNFDQRVVRVTPAGMTETLLTVDDGLDGPTSAAFGVKNHKEGSLYREWSPSTVPGPEPSSAQHHAAPHRDQRRAAAVTRRTSPTMLSSCGKPCGASVFVTDNVGVNHARLARETAVLQLLLTNLQRPKSVCP